MLIFDFRCQTKYFYEISIRKLTNRTPVLSSTIHLTDSKDVQDLQLKGKRTRTKYTMYRKISVSYSNHYKSKFYLQLYMKNVKKNKIKQQLWSIIGVICVWHSFKWISKLYLNIFCNLIYVESNWQAMLHLLNCEL